MPGARSATGADAGTDSTESARAIGLMSGTSVDGIDGVLAALSAGESARNSAPTVEISIEATVHVEFPAEVRAQIEALIARPAAADLDAVGRLHTQLGGLYAAAANRLMRETGSHVHGPAVIGCPGQTIRHGPHGEFPFTWQLGDGAVVARLTGRPVVADFRAADMAAGGEGAPLAPAFHHAVFASAAETRAIVNLGGIANLTFLPAATDATAATGFDTGPANTLIDDWCRRHFDARFDESGDLAATGTVHRGLLDALLAEPYFARRPPKSCGRELFNRNWLARILDGGGDGGDGEFAKLPAADVLATLTMLTAATVGAEVRRLEPAVQRVFVCGGGARNRTLRAFLGDCCGAEIADTAALGIAPQWVEACAFAYLAWQTLRRVPATLPAVTGASRPTVAGAIYFPD